MSEADYHTIVTQGKGIGQQGDKAVHYFQFGWAFRVNVGRSGYGCWSMRWRKERVVRGGKLQVLCTP